MLSAPTARAGQRETLGDLREEQPAFAPVWTGILHEFRNHLTVLMAVATELRSEIPPALALQVGEALGETERNVQSLMSLLALVEASVRTVDPVIADLDDVVERAIRLAAPAVGRRVSITAELGRRSGIRNRGSALESLFAALIIDLARARGVATASNDLGPEVARPRHVRLRVDITRGSLSVDLESDGPRPAPASWRFLIASDLAEKLDAKITSTSTSTSTSSPSDPATYTVHFR
jgi:hypothetical protein